MYFEIDLIPLVLIAIVLMLAFFAIRREVWAHRRRRDWISKRKELKIADWLKLHSWNEAPDPTSALEILSFLSGELDVTPTKVLPGDRFNKELACNCWLPHGDGAWEAITEEFPTAFGMQWCADWRIVADIVQAVSKNRKMTTNSETCPSQKLHPLD